MRHLRPYLKCAVVPVLVFTSICSTSHAQDPAPLTAPSGVDIELLEQVPEPASSESVELTEPTQQAALPDLSLGAGVFSIVNPLDSSDPRLISLLADEQMSFGPCPGSSSPSGGDCLRHNVERPPNGDGLEGGTANWILDGIDGDEAYLSWWQKLDNRENVGQSTKLYGLASPTTIGFGSYQPSGNLSAGQWNSDYADGIGGQGGGAGGYYHGHGTGPNGLGHGWSARMIHLPGFGNFTNTGQLGIETYHTDSTNFLTQNGQTRQFGENINPFTNPRRVGIDRITGNDWHHYCLRVKLNSLSLSPQNGINRDGILQLYVDQNLVIDRQNLHFTEDPAYRKFRAYLLVFGGGSKVNTEDWQAYTTGIRYSSTECVVQ